MQHSDNKPRQREGKLGSPRSTKGDLEKKYSQRPSGTKKLSGVLTASHKNRSNMRGKMDSPKIRVLSETDEFSEIPSSEMPSNLRSRLCPDGGNRIGPGALKSQVAAKSSSANRGSERSVEESKGSLGRGAKKPQFGGIFVNSKEGGGISSRHHSAKDENREGASRMESPSARITVTQAAEKPGSRQTTERAVEMSPSSKAFFTRQSKPPAYHFRPSQVGQSPVRGSFTKHLNQKHQPNKRIFSPKG